MTHVSQDLTFVFTEFDRVLCIARALLYRVRYQASLPHQKIHTYGDDYVM